MAKSKNNRSTVKNRTKSKSPPIGWWYVKFKIYWSEDLYTNWHLDLFIAHKVVKPVLLKHKKEILLWRFHRRANSDETGHQLSFIFHSSQETAKKIYNAFKSDNLLKNLKRSKLIEKIRYDNTSKIVKPNIEDTGNPNWSLEIQRSWPYYIMGVSEMWLDLISQISGNVIDKKEKMTTKKKVDSYREIEKEINIIWQSSGRHPFLHHLNAIFGYIPIITLQQF